jgi:hypothetical protein
MATADPGDARASRFGGWSVQKQMEHAHRRGRGLESALSCTSSVAQRALANGMAESGRSVGMFQQRSELRVNRREASVYIRCVYISLR